MDVADITQQNGLSKKVYTEENEDGTITEYQEERYLVVGDDNANTKPGEVVLIKDEPNMQVYQRHELLDDGREIITTTTLITDEDGEVTEETVTEVLESEECETDEDEQAEESAEEGVLQVNGDQPSDQEELDDIPEEDQADDTEDRPEDERYEVESFTPPEEVEQLIQEETPEEAQKLAEEDTQTQEEETTSLEQEETADAGRNTKLMRKFEDYEQQFTEYKPPKRYEKKQSDSALDKLAPRITIMGLNKNDFAQPKVPASPEKDCDNVTSAEVIRADDEIDDGLEACTGAGRNRATFEQSSEPLLPNQPTKTQGSIIRRMDSAQEPVDTDKLVKADDPPNYEAELPAQGTSRNLRNKFQSMESDHVPAVCNDKTTPVKEKLRTGVYGYSTNGLVSPPVNGEAIDHTEPAFEGGEIENDPEVRPDLIREADRNDDEELPESGIAKNLLSRFKSLETENQNLRQVEHKPSGVGSKPVVTPLRPSSAIVVNASSADQEADVQPEGGEFENEPEVRDDLIKESDRYDEEELPSVGVTKNLLSTFREKENAAKNAPVYKPSGVGYRPPRPNSRATSETSQEPHEEPQFEGGEVENTPMARADVVREADRNDEEELPERGTTKNIMARYSQQLEVSKQDYKIHKPSGVASKATPTPLGASRSYSRNASLTGSRTSMLSDDTTDSIDQPIAEPQVEGGEFENTPVKREDLLREEDRNDEEELPEQGLAKNLLSKFQNIEQESVKMRKSQYKPSGVGTKPTPTPLWPSRRLDVEVISEETIPIPPEGGSYENTPVPRDDVVRESDLVNDQDLPELGLTQNLRTQFQDLDNNSEPEYKPSGISQKPTPTPLWPSHREDIQIVSGETIPNPPEGGSFENTPIQRDDVVRERDLLNDQSLPEHGLTRNLRTQFQDLDNNSEPDYKPSGISQKATPSAMHIMAGRSSYHKSGTSSQAPASTEVVYEEPQVEGGEFENEPEVRTDVAKEDIRIDEEELPEQGITKNIMSRFLSMEEQNTKTQQHIPSGVASKPTPTPLRPVSSGATEITTEETAPPAPDGGEYENAPEQNSNVVRSSDSNEQEHIPAAGAAKNVMARFKELEKSTSNDQAVHTPSKIASSATPTPLTLKR